MQPPQDIETIVKQIRTFKQDAETGKGVWQVSGKAIRQAALKTEELDDQVVVGNVQNQQALVKGLQLTQELLSCFVQQQLNNWHISVSSKKDRY